MKTDIMQKEYAPADKNIFTREEVYEHLRKVIADPVFLVSKVLTNFLTYIVSETVEGRTNQLKEYSIGISVLNREHHFRPQKDGVVRVHASRLRRALKLYYEEAGKSDSMRIYVPKGSYVPDFYERDSYTDIYNRSFNFIEDIQHLNHRNHKLQTGVLPFYCFPQTTMVMSFASGFTSCLSTELVNLRNLSVIAVHVTNEFSEKSFYMKDIVKKTSAEYLFTGNIQYHANRMRVNIQLVYTHTMEQVWGQTYNRVIDDNNLFEIQDEIVKAVITEMEVFWGSKERTKSKTTTMAVA